MIVIDTSALIDSILADPPREGLRQRVFEEDLHAPHLIDVEAVNTLRRLVRVGAIDIDRAMRVLVSVDQLPIIRYPHGQLRWRVWEMRDNLTGYDAAFVALAEALGAPLVTTDAHLARASGHQAVVEFFSPLS